MELRWSQHRTQGKSIPLRGMFINYLVRKGGLEPPRVAPPDPKSGASANSATLASCYQLVTDFSDRLRMLALDFGAHRGFVVILAEMDISHRSYVL